MFDSWNSAWLCSIMFFSCFSVIGLPTFFTYINNTKLEAFSNCPLMCKNSSDSSAELYDTYCM